MFVTTSRNPTTDTVNTATKIAQELRLQLFPRRHYSLSQLKKTHKDDQVLVVSEDGPKYVYPDGTTLYFHPSLARIRITSMMKGSKDRLVEIAGIQKGDTVLDCTTGLGTDAIVLSCAVGKTGRVVTVENSLVLCVLAREGFANYDPGIKEIKDAMRRIKIVNADHTEYMKNLPDKSVDVVYFDPMFRKAAKTVALTPLRELANSSALKVEAIKEAKRIARKSVVLKEHYKSGEFERLGFEIAGHKKNSKFDYGVIQV